MIGYGGKGTPCLCGEKNTWHKACYRDQAVEMKALKDENEKLRNAIEQCKPVMEAHAGPTRLAKFKAALAKIEGERHD